MRVSWLEQTIKSTFIGLSISLNLTRNLFDDFKTEICDYPLHLSKLKNVSNNLSGYAWILSKNLNFEYIQR